MIRDRLYVRTIFNCLSCNLNLKVKTKHLAVLLKDSKSYENPDYILHRTTFCTGSISVVGFFDKERRIQNQPSQFPHHLVQ